LTNSTHGQLPGDPETGWLYAKIHTHPHLFDELIAEQVPQLLAAFDDQPLWWFVRYRSHQETDHLRLRIRTPNRDHHVAGLVAVGAWAQSLRREHMAGRLVLDTYHPETGRYGHGAAMAAAEEVFATDSQLVALQLRHLPAIVIDPIALAAVNMVSTVHGFLGNLAEATRWLLARAAPRGAAAADRDVAEHVIGLVRGGMPRNLPNWEGRVAHAWQARTAALATYRTRLSAHADTDAILEALLHMHHNRALGIDRDSEATCRYLARRAAQAWTAQQNGPDR
jgi:thiopeptide-type bacteriocin biosynthesis protein